MKTLLIILTAVSISACSTVAGMGKDITRASEWTQEKMKGTPL
jgi:predicted small secreted protein